MTQPNFHLIVMTFCHLCLELEVVELEAKCLTTKLSSDCDDSPQPTFPLIVMTLCHFFPELEVVELEAKRTFEVLS